jgi:OmcA/MtrC family decaheme c-type cytochrome
MKSLRGGLVMAMTAGAFIVLPMSNTRLTQVVSRAGPAQSSDPKTIYAPQQKEYWLSADEFGYIRPGLKITVNSITINDGLHPVVDINYTDDMGQPLDRKGQITAGPLSINMILAWWDAGERQYTSYTTRQRTSASTSPNPGVTVTQAAADAPKSSTAPNGGTWNDIDLGHSIYTFGTALPAGYDKTITTTLGIYATRNMAGIQDKNYYSNVEQDFVPNGAPVTEVWDEIANSACNTCHNPLAAHGGPRRDVKLCVLCHSPQTVNPDTGNTVDFKVMVHKIHMSENLPSVKDGIPYQFIGRGSTTDFSDIAFPQDIRNCATCHAAPATQASTWYTYPAREPCGACHDNVNWTTGENHAGGPQLNDNLCATCHLPVGSREWDASVQGAHTVPYNSTQLKGIVSTIVSVANTAPGQNPTIQFQLKQNDGTPIAPAYFGTGRILAVLMGGPTTDYAVNPNAFRENANGATFDGTTATYTFTHAIPQDATGTWAFSLEARQVVTLDPHPTDELTYEEATFNPVYYAAVTDTEPQPRRLVVDLDNCNKCHNKLMLHGNLRQNTQMCVICHNPNESDAARRPADQTPPESVDMKRMIHRIHTGVELAQDYTIYGFLGSVNNFNNVRYPGDRRDCLQCHATDTQQVLEDPPAGLLPTLTLRDWYTPMQHYAAACLGCHDTKPAAAHAFQMTAPFGEACFVCHGAGTGFAVDKVHAR